MLGLVLEARLYIKRWPWIRGFCLPFLELHLSCLQREFSLGVGQKWAVSYKSIIPSFGVFWEIDTFNQARAATWSHLLFRTLWWCRAIPIVSTLHISTWDKKRPCDLSWHHSHKSKSHPGASEKWGLKTLIKLCPAAGACPSSSTPDSVLMVQMETRWNINAWFCPGFILLFLWGQGQIVWSLCSLVFLSIKSDDTKSVNW
jgi:hypothetical protein